MSQLALIPQTLEEDLYSNLAPENDQRTFVSFCHLGLIRVESGLLGELDADFLVPPPGIPMRMVRCDEDRGIRMLCCE